MDGAHTHIPPPARGFTLIEISIVVAIVLTLLTLGLGFVTAQLSSAAYSITKQRQTAIKDALIAYLGANRRLPCPYVPTAGTTVTGQTPAQSTPVACPAPGIVPFATLGLSRELTEDGWGNFFSYRVFADPSPGCSSDKWDWGNVNCFGEGKDGITPARSAQRINDGTVTASTPISDKSIAVIVSHGANGLGAWAAQGTRNAATTTCEEAHNAAGTTPPSGCTIASDTYYKGERPENDDVVAYLTASDALQTLTKQGAIKSAVAKVNEDLHLLFERAVGNYLKNCASPSSSPPEKDPWGKSYQYETTNHYYFSDTNPQDFRSRVVETIVLDSYRMKLGLEPC